MNPPSNDLGDIRGFRAIDEFLGTSGQPTEAQFTVIRDAGYEVVINLALPTSDHALPHEGSLVTGLGQIYMQLPVVFAAPSPADFRAFCGVMEAFAGRRIFIHCAANFRVSAFVFLYRVLRKKVPVADAAIDLLAVWQPDAVWSRFIADRFTEEGLLLPPGLLPAGEQESTIGSGSSGSPPAASTPSAISTPHRIEPARETDLAALSGLLGVLFTQEAEFTPDEAAQVRGLARILRSPETGTLLVLREDGNILGMVSLLYTVSTALGAKVAWLEDMVVAPSARERGLGSALLRQAIAFARGKGCKRLTLLTDGTNHGAQRFYTRHGFVPSDMRPMRLALD